MIRPFMASRTPGDDMVHQAQITSHSKRKLRKLSDLLQMNNQYACFEGVSTSATVLQLQPDKFDTQAPKPRLQTQEKSSRASLGDNQTNLAEANAAMHPRFMKGNVREQSVSGKHNKDGQESKVTKETTTFRNCQRYIDAQKATPSHQASKQDVTRFAAAAVSPLLSSLIIPTLKEINQSGQDLIDKAKGTGNGCGTAVHVRKTYSKQKKKLANTRSSLREISIEHFWEVIRPDIDYVHNVDSDGHCGFRAVAVGLGMDKKDGWLTVREELIAELESFKDDYMKILGDEGDVNQLLDALDCTISPCPPENWFTLPTMGHLVASRYEVVFVCISKEGALTFVPLRSPPSTVKPKVIAIGNVERVHFVSIKLKPGCPIPEPMKIWGSSKVAEGWGSLLKNRSDALKANQGHQPSAHEGDEADPIIVE
ncbi:hypothetical protein AQUCO_02600217v1 [Aquilegia coerulea]|uniref:OTU domain-containing protein n=1 Tax=Aquilegia coerulea TaxID=218851 RepID=A0A2G5D7W7_AQUCA|nr:hypothetical protein AQUCO_02600217v1 [Aquilegia coerulea]